ncbi:phage portal protein [Pusillimonas sp. TS35]|nr:phage portal protein [Pusillimonas sp. TS35]
MLSKILSHFGYEKRVNGDPYWENFGAIRTGPVNATTAQSVSAVYACVSAISETIASLPLHLYERGQERTKAVKHPLYTVLHDISNQHQTALEFREWMTASVLVRGNAFAKIERGWDGQVRSLTPIHPDRVSLYRTTNSVIYEYTDHAGKVEKLLADEVFHLKHRAGDEVLLGVSPITASRETIELSISERNHGNATFTNGARLSGILKFPQLLKAEQKAALKTSWDSQHSGGANAGKTAILDQGVEYQTVSMTLEDAEWIAARKFSVEEVARLFRVPPTIIGDLTHGNFSNSVEMTRMFVTLTLRRHLLMWEQAISKQLLTTAGRAKYKPEHSVEGLLRGDAKNRADFYKSGIEAGWLLPSEARRLENLPAIEGIDNDRPEQ